MLVSGRKSSSGSLSTVVDIDFSALADQTISASGNFTLGGVTWVAYNVAHSQTFALQNGSGLYVRASSYNSNPISGTFDAPGAYVPLSNLAAALARSCWTEAWVLFLHSQPHTPNANWEGSETGVQLGATTTPVNRCGWSLQRGYDDGVGGSNRYNGYGKANILGASSVNQGGHFPEVATLDVSAFRLHGAMVEGYSGTSVGGTFPERYNLSLEFAANAMGNPLSGSSFGFDRSPIWCAFFHAFPSNTAGNSDILIKRLRVLTR